MTTSMTKAQKEHQRVMALLSENESAATTGAEFENLFEASVKERDFDALLLLAAASHPGRNRRIAA